ncbi:MAG: hypothetical protein ABI415_09300 [Flavitalea sp.]
MKKMQLLHPSGKPSNEMDVEKYQILKTALHNCLHQHPENTFSSLLIAVEKKLKENNSTIAGSLQWILMLVLLDLEARKEISSTGLHAEGMKYSLNKQYQH